MSFGGTLSATRVSGGATLQLDSGALAFGNTLLAGSLVSGAGAIGGVTLDYGTLSGVQIAGTLNVESGATNSGTTLLSGGREVLLSGATDTGDTIVAGGSETVSAGGTSLNVVVLAGGVLSNAGSVTVATLEGTTIGVEITGSESLDIASGGVASNSLVSALYRNDVAQGQGIYVEAGGSAVETVVALGGLLDLEGGTATRTTVQAGGVIFGNGSVLSGVTTNAGGVISSADVAGTVVISTGALGHRGHGSVRGRGARAGGRLGRGRHGVSRRRAVRRRFSWSAGPTSTSTTAW